ICRTLPHTLPRWEPAGLRGRLSLRRQRNSTSSTISSNRTGSKVQPSIAYAKAIPTCAKHSGKTVPHSGVPGSFVAGGIQAFLLGLNGAPAKYAIQTTGLAWKVMDRRQFTASLLALTAGAAFASDR